MAWKPTQGNTAHFMPTFFRFTEFAGGFSVQENTLFRQQRTQARRRSDQFKAKLKHKRLALEFGKEAGASSSMMEDRKKVVERILTELHHGNFRSVVPSSHLSTPEQEEMPSLPEEKKEKKMATLRPLSAQSVTPTPSTCTTPMGRSPVSKKRPLELSHISIAGTPMMNRPTSENLDDDLFHFTPGQPGKKIIMTSSANDLLDGPAAPSQPNPHQQPMQAHPRVTQLAAATPSTAHHHRSKSDLTDSILVDNKWLKYEEMKRKEKQNQEGVNAPLAIPESSMTLATLNLEDVWARRLEGDHLMKLNAGPVVYEPETKDKKEKKGGIGGFFSRFTRAVLGSRSSAANVERNILRPSQTQDRRKLRTSSDTTGKENDAFQLGDAKRSSKRLGRFRAHKYSG